MKNEIIKVKTINRIPTHLYEVTSYSSPMGNNNLTEN